MIEDRYFVFRPTTGEVFYRGFDKEEAEKKLVHRKDIVLTSVSRSEDGVSIVRKFYEDYDRGRFCQTHIKQSYYTKRELELLLEALGNSSQSD